MNTKEAIEKVERISYIFEADEIFKQNGIQIMEVINLLKRGEKYEAMWEELRKDTESCGAWWQSELMGLEQKYFPEPKNKLEDTKDTIGEKYKKMWEEFKEIIKNQHSGNDDNVNYYDLIELEEKYFPKEVKSDGS